MTSLLLSAKIVLPLFFLMGVGYLVRRLGWLSGKTLDEINNLCFRLFLPASLFKNIYKADLSRLAKPGFLIFAVGIQLLIFFLLLACIPRLIRDNPARGTTAQAIFRTNFILFGLVIASEFSSGADLSVVSLLAAVIIPLYNIGGVLLLERFRGGQPSPRAMLRQICTNPFVISCILGFLVLSLPFSTPAVFDKLVGDLASVASPLSLLALGAWFRPATLGRYRRELIIGTTGRLIMAPALGILGGILAGFRDAELLAIVCMLISPTAVATFNMAQKMDGDADLACLLVIVQSVLSMFTMFLWIFLLNMLGFLPAP